MYIFSALGMDSQWVIAILPRLVQAAVATGGDIAAARVYTLILGDSRGKWAFAAHMLNFFMLFTFVQTISNSVEAAIVWAALSLWPLTKVLWVAAPVRVARQEDLRWSFVGAVVLAGFSVALRPTAAVIWAFLGTALLLQQRSLRSAVLLALSAGCTLAVVLAGSMTLDTLVYGEVEFVLWNFFDFNINAGLSSLYGTHPWHWYLSSGIPTILGLMLPLFLVGVKQSFMSTMARGGSLFWAGLLAFCVALYSIPGHKEFRFLLPLFPVMFMFVGIALHNLAADYFVGEAPAVPATAKTASHASAAEGEATMPQAGVTDVTNLSCRSLAEPAAPVNSDKSDHQPVTGPSADVTVAATAPVPVWGGAWLYPLTMSLLVVGNAAGALYLGAVHQRGTIAAVKFIAQEAAAFRLNPAMLYSPPGSEAGGAMSQALEWKYIREHATLGKLNRRLIPGIPPPTGDRSVLRKQPLSGGATLHFANAKRTQDGWTMVAPQDATSSSDRFKHAFGVRAFKSSVWSWLAEAEDRLATWLRWPVQREHLAELAVQYLGVGPAAELGLVTLDPWGNLAAKPSPRRALARWEAAQRSKARGGDSDASSQQRKPKPEFVPMIVHFWLGCHAAPFYSVVHEPIEMTQLECPPLARMAGGTDEAQFQSDPHDFMFKWYGVQPTAPPPPHVVHTPTLVANDARYAGPVQGMRLPALQNETRWLQDYHTAQRQNSMQRTGNVYNATRVGHDLPRTGRLPTHIITTAATERRMRGWLRTHDFFVARRFFHSHLQGDGDADGEHIGEVVVLRHASWTTWALMTGQAVLKNGP
jgi:hypothetical protein